eukprot:1195349-Prorocentrum_minimum.AAC.1
MHIFTQGFRLPQRHQNELRGRRVTHALIILCKWRYRHISTRKNCRRTHTSSSSSVASTVPSVDMRLPEVSSVHSGNSVGPLEMLRSIGKVGSSWSLEKSTNVESTLIPRAPTQYRLFSARLGSVSAAPLPSKLLFPITPVNPLLACVLC